MAIKFAVEQPKPKQPMKAKPVAGRSRGRPRVDAPKEAVTLRLDPGTVARFKSSGKDWRSKMADVLASAKL